MLRQLKNTGSLSIRLPDNNIGGKIYVYQI